MNTIDSGSVLKFKLDHDFGFGYCKLVNFTTTNSLTRVVLKVYDIYGNNDFLFEEVVEQDFLLNPIRIYEFPNLRGRGAWKIIGNDLNESDDKIPIFKKAPSRLLDKEWNEAECKKWWTIHDFTEDGNFCDYRRVGHLEHMHLFYKSTVVIRTTMEIIKLRGEKIEDYYDVEDLSYLWHYFNSINVPFIKDIPVEYRGTILPKSIIEKYDGVPFRSHQANPIAVINSPLSK